MAALIWAAPASAQVFELGDWGGDITAIVQYGRTEIKAGSSPKSTFENLFTQERLSLRNSGAYVIDPDLFMISGGATVGLSQERLTSDTDEFHREGTLWGYDVLASFLPDRPTSLSVFASRNESFLSRELAGEQRSLTEGWGGLLNLTTLYIPSTLSFRRNQRDDEIRVAGSVTRFSDKQDTVTYRGSRGWIDSEMEILYEFIDFTDNLVPNVSYRSHEGSLTYNLDFGQELNRHWDSHVRALSRTGLASINIYSVSEALRIEHTDAFKTSYRYVFINTEAQGQTSMSHLGGFGLQHRLYNNLTTTFDLNGTHQTLPGGQKDIYRTTLDLSYYKTLFWRGNLNISGGGALEYEDDRFSTTESFVPQESHTAATPFALPIALNNPFVDTSSAVITKVATGPLPIGCFSPPGPPTPLILGRDYTLRTTGSITEVVPIPCSGVIPGINAGDTIAVDYRFSVSPSLKFYTVSRHGEVSLDFPWFRPYFSHQRIEQTLLSGQGGQFLDTRETNTAGAELRYDGKRVRASVLGEARRYTSQRQSFDGFRSVQTLNVTILPEWTVTLSGDEEQFEYKDPKHITRILAARGASSHILWENLYADLFGGYRVFKDTLVPTERTIEAGLKVRWFVRKLEINPELGFADRRRGDTASKDYRGMLTIIRRF